MKLPLKRVIIPGLLALLLVGSIAFLSLAQAPPQAVPRQQMSEEAFKNVTVLKGIPVVSLSTEIRYDLCNTIFKHSEALTAKIGDNLTLPVMDRQVNIHEVDVNKECLLLHYMHRRKRNDKTNNA